MSQWDTSRQCPRTSPAHARPTLIGYDPDLSAYYDQDAARRDAAGLSGLRSSYRQQFLALTTGEGRQRVAEIGCGPGHDGLGFAAAGMEWTGFDLSVEHARIASGHGLRAMAGSLFDPPLRPGAFDAGWSMSTLVHVADEDFDRAMRAIVTIVQPGSPLGLGLWGGVDVEGVNAQDLYDPPRFFSRRSHKRTRLMLSAHGRLEHFETADIEPEQGWVYQFAILRTPR